MRMRSRIVLPLAALITLPACDLTRTAAGATDGTPGPTEAALCRAWGESLPTRSRSDTGRTAEEIEAGYTDFASACPDFVHLIPNRSGA
ncbi:MAG: hypothetical protein QNJ16_15870 [Rhodobacter sp.]|nr:hypothetical protein [Rhodobacter sp.]